MNQLCFVYSRRQTSAATVTLFLGDAADLHRRCRARRRARAPAARRSGSPRRVSFAGVALRRVRLGRRSPATSAATRSRSRRPRRGPRTRSLIAPLMARYSPFRISSLVLLLRLDPARSHRARIRRRAELPLRHAGLGRASPSRSSGRSFLTNMLWFTAIDRVGPSRASLFANLQPFFGVVFALAPPRRAR